MRTDDDVELLNRRKEEFKLNRKILRKSIRIAKRTYFEHIFTQHVNHDIVFILIIRKHLIQYPINV